MRNWDQECIPGDCWLLHGDLSRPSHLISLDVVLLFILWRSCVTVRCFVWHNLRLASGPHERCIRWRSQQTHHGHLKFHFSFFPGKYCFFQPRPLGFPLFYVAALEVSFLPWLDEDDNMKHGQILLVVMTLVFYSRRRGAKNAIGFQKKVVSSANWKQAFDWIWTDWDRLGYFMEIFGCLGLCLFALYRYLSSGFDFPPRLCCDTEEAESYATPARSPFVGFRCDLGNCTSGMVPS